MNKKIYKPKLYNGLFLGFSTLFVVTLAGRAIAMKNAAAINGTLGISTSNKSEGDDDSFFSRTYKSDEDVRNYFKSVAEEVEGEGLVLLKNDNNALPLKSDAKISLLGTASVDFNYNTSGSSETDSSTYASLSDTLKGLGFLTNDTLEAFYKTGEGKGYGRKYENQVYTINEVPYSKYSDTVLNSITTYSDAAIVTLARSSGEGKDISTAKSDGLDGSYLSLSQEEVDLLKGLTTLKKEKKLSKIIVLLNSSNMIQLDFLDNVDIDVDSLLWIGNVGSYGLNAVGKVLNGTINPSGRLSDTYCKNNFSSPAMASWGLNNNKSFGLGYSNFSQAKLTDINRAYGVYNEGVYVGYRYYETRYEDSVLSRTNTGEYNYLDDVAYTFGYGLSYTDFEYSNFKVETEEDKYVVSVDVKNTGSVEGKHTVEVYYQRPYTDYDKQQGIEKPSVELGAFAKTGLLKSGDKETVKLEVKKSQFKTYDASGYKTYILEKGDYYLSLGSDAHNAINNILLSKDSNYQSKLIGSGNKDFAYKISIADTDTITYSKSEYTGESITNQLDHADMNRYEGKGNNSVTYTSRNDWTGTWPKEKIVFSVTDQMKSDLSSHKTLPSDGTMPKYNSGKKTSLVSLREKDYDDEKWDELLDSMSKEDQIKLVTTGNMGTAALGSDTSVGLPATNCKDGPTSITTTKTSSSFPSEGIWASSFNTELIKKVGDAFAEDIILAGSEGIYAPGVNIHRTPFGGRSNEYFSEDPLLTGIAAVYEIQGLQNKGIITHLKHFAFNECETYRSGIAIWLNEQEAREIMLLPFELAVTEGKTGSVMSSFNRAGCIWTGADSNLSINILQKEWGFDGYAITDMGESNAKNYMTYDDGFMNGTNLFMTNADELKEYKDNAAICQKIRESSHRILYTICNKSRAMTTSEIKEITPWWENLLNTLVITSGIVGGLSLGLYIYCLVSKKLEN